MEKALSGRPATTPSTRKQSTGLAQVNSAVNQMDQVTQRNAGMVEESAAASHALAQESARLAELMAQFRIGADEAAPAAADRGARSQQQRLRQAFG